jgi:hemin uptake protein HemP
MESQPISHTSPPPSAEPIVMSVSALLREQRILVIEHAGKRYQLRLTRNGKLILTK